jgi:UDP-4-amino-4,6-dideoxy-N-acetyl-beta-L-altrosamine N-acetyltransferase
MISLRPLRVDDGDMVRAWRNQPHVAAMMYTDHAISAEEHGRWLAATLTDEAKRYFIVEEAGAPIGLAGFTAITAHSASWAFYLAAAETRGRGLGAQTEFQMLAYAFETLGLDELRCEVLVRNPAVIALHESFGFARTGILLGRAFKDGAREDVVTLVMRAADWPSAKARAQTRLAQRAPA